MTSILSIVLGLLVLGVLVFIHELGHFLAAKWCGIKVLAFSIGFGNPLFKRSYKGTEYRIGTIPFGGYVKMAGENPDETRQGEPDEFPSRPIWQRALVAFAGPAANFVTAILMLWVLFIYGVERPLYYENPTVGAVMDSSAARIAGIEAGDSIISIDGKQIKSWEDIDAAFALQQNSHKVEYLRNGQKNTVTLEMPKQEKLIPEFPTGGMLKPLPANVAEVVTNSPAQEAGIQKGDKVISINGKRIFSWFELVTIVGEYKQSEEPLQVNVMRGDSIMTFSLKPQFNQETKRNQIGIRVDEGEVRLVRYSPVAAVPKCLDKAWEYTTMIFDVIGKLVSREVPASQLSGPIGIIPASGFMVLQGVSPILNFMALIGIQLAVLNLMPLVITDGGILFFLLIEAIRRKPLSIKTQMIFSKIAIAFFLLLFLFVTFNDIKHLPDFFKLFSR